ncbi:MAG TPA: universal stress protein [Polyangia bacterium]
MFQKLLCPLDGSHLAEAALPAAAYLCDRLGSQVVLVHVIERGAPGAVHGDHHLTRPDEAEAYLAAVAARAFPPGAEALHHVHEGATADVAQSIVEHAVELQRDLVVMCTHGRGGLKDLLFGSIAQKVVARGQTPVLLVFPDTEAASAPFVCRRILVPLDGSHDHERGLPTATQLAARLGAELHLVMVVPTLGTLAGEEALTGQLLPSATRAVLELTSESAAAYLGGHVARLAAEGLAVTASVERGATAAAIAAIAERAGADLIVLASHGRVGVDAVVAGSVAPRVSRRRVAPVLLMPIPEGPP